MTTEKLKEIIAIEARINELEKIILSTKNQKCEWIEFTFGNGSNRANVCNTKETIDAVRKVLLHENEQELRLLKIKFDKI